MYALRHAHPPEPHSEGRKAFILIEIGDTKAIALLDTGNLSKANFLPLPLAVNQRKPLEPTTLLFSSAIGVQDIKPLGTVTIVCNLGGFLLPIEFQVTSTINRTIISNSFLEAHGGILNFRSSRVQFLFGDTHIDLPLLADETSGNLPPTSPKAATVCDGLAYLTERTRALATSSSFASAMPAAGKYAPFVYSGLPRQQAHALRELATEFSDVFRDISEGPRGIHKEGKPFLTSIPLRHNFIPRPRPSPMKLGPLHDLVVKRYVKKKVLEQTLRNPPFINPCFLVEKKNKDLPLDDPAKYRLVVNPAVNGGVISGSRTPDSPEMQAARLVGNGKFMLSTDGSDQFFQFLLTQASTMLCCVSSGNVIYRFVCLIQGMENSSSVVQSANDWIFGKSLSQGLEAFIDNYCLARDEFEPFLVAARVFFEEARASNLRLNAKDTFLGFPTVVHVGMQVSTDGFCPAARHAQGIQDFTSPGKVDDYTKAKALCGNFVNVASIWARFITQFEPAAVILRNFAKGVSQWGGEEEKAFRHMQSEMSSKRVMKPFQMGRLTVVRFDANESEVFRGRHCLAGCLLQQYGEDLFPVAFASRLMTPSEEASIQGSEAVISTRMEALAGAFCCDRWFFYLRCLKFFYLWPDSSNLNHAKTATSEFMLAFFGFLLCRFTPSQVRIAADLRHHNKMSDSCGRGSHAEIADSDSILLAIGGRSGLAKVAKPSSLGRIARPIIPPNAFAKSQGFTVEPPVFHKGMFSLQESDKLKKSKSYVIRNNTWVYVKPGGSFGQMLVPYSFQKKFLIWAHSDKDGVHLTLKDTKAKAEPYFFPGILAAIANHFSACGECQVAIGPSSRRHEVTGLNIQASYYGEIVLMDFKEFGGLLYITIMDSCTRHVFMEKEPDKSLDSAKHGWSSWSKNGVRVRFLYCDKEKSLVCEEFKLFVASFDGTLVVPSKGRDSEHIAPLERFHKELGIEERKLGSDELAVKELPNILRRWHQSFDGPTHVSRADSCFGADPLFARLALRQSVLTERNRAAARQRTEPLVVKVGDRVKILAHNPRKRDPLVRLAIVQAVRPGTALVKWEDTGESTEVNTREIVGIIANVPEVEPVSLPRKGDIVMTNSRNFFRIVAVESKTCKGSLLVAVNKRLGIKKRSFETMWRVSETGTQVAENKPTASSTPIVEVIHYSDIVTIGELKKSGKLSQTLILAYTSHDSESDEDFP